MRKSLAVWIWLPVILFTCFASGARATTYFVTAGDDLTLSSVLSSSSPCSVIIINQPVGGPYFSFSSPVTLVPNNSGTKNHGCSGRSRRMGHAWRRLYGTFAKLGTALSANVSETAITRKFNEQGDRVTSDHTCV
jgi:hypothetical protein